MSSTVDKPSTGQVASSQPRSSSGSPMVVSGQWSVHDRVQFRSVMTVHNVSEMVVAINHARVERVGPMTARVVVRVTKTLQSNRTAIDGPQAVTPSTMARPIRQRISGDPACSAGNPVMGANPSTGSVKSKAMTSTFSSGHPRISLG